MMPTMKKSKSSPKRKICNKCKKQRAIKFFCKYTIKHKKQDGSIVLYTAYKSRCNTCLSKINAAAYKDHAANRVPEDELTPFVKSPFLPEVPFRSTKYTADVYMGY